MAKPSRIIAGTMNWGQHGKNLSTHEMADLINCCIENGINAFDHADIYGGYTMEESFGKAFMQSGVKRDDAFFISKCGIQKPHPGRAKSVKYYDYSKEHIVKSVDNSLANLRTEYLDVLLLHRPSPLMHPEEVAQAVETLKTQGKLREFGVSNFTVSQTELLLSKTDISYNQICFSATHNEPMTDGSLDFMMLRGIKPMAWSPLGTVFKDESTQSDRLIGLLANLMIKYEVSVEVILIAWVLQHPSGILPVCGTSTASRIKALSRADLCLLGIEDWFAIWTESRGTQVP